MRNGRTLDHCYTTIRQAYRAIARPAFGMWDHYYVLLVSVYKLRLKTMPTTVRTVRRWSEDYILQLWGGLEITDWSVFKTTNLNVYADHVGGYINGTVDEP